MNKFFSCLFEGPHDRNSVLGSSLKGKKGIEFELRALISRGERRAITIQKEERSFEDEIQCHCSRVEEMDRDVEMGMELVAEASRWTEAVVNQGVTCWALR